MMSSLRTWHHGPKRRLWTWKDAGLGFNSTPPTKRGAENKFLVFSEPPCSRL